MKKTVEICFIIALVIEAASLVRLLAGENEYIDFGPAVAQAQKVQPAVTGYKTLVVMRGALTSPLVITKVSVGNKALLPGSPPGKRAANQIFDGRPFQAGEGWFSRMTIHIKNRTDKTVEWVNLDLLFPKPASGTWGLLAIKSIQLGRVPDADVPVFRGVDGAPVHFPPSLKPLDLRPGQEVIVHVSHYMDSIRRMVGRIMPLAAVARIRIDIASCYFNDGMRWNLGVYSVLDKSHPGKMKKLPSGYFPGNLHQSRSPSG